MSRTELNEAIDEICQRLGGYGTLAIDELLGLLDDLHALLACRSNDDATIWRDIETNQRSNEINGWT